MTHNPVGTYGRLFPQHHIPVILLLILQVGKTIRKKTSTDLEDWLTTKLHRRLIHEPIFRDGPLRIDPQTSIVSSETDPEKNTPEGRLDLQVSCGHGYEVYFAIEAKRLRVSLPSRFFSGGPEYVKDGMLRFITGQYAPFMHAGAMLGYVYDGETENARAEVDRQIQKKAKELRLKGAKRLMASPILPGHPIDETNHDLKNRPFTIFHLFLDV